MILKVVSPKDKYKDNEVYERIVEYCLNPCKRKHVRYAKAYNMNLRTAAEEMKELTEYYGMMKGTRIRHMVLAFDPLTEKYIRAKDVNEIAKEACKYYRYLGYQILYAVHEDLDFIHAHIVLNTVRMTDGKKYKGDRKDYHSFQNYLNRILRNFDTTLTGTVY